MHGDECHVRALGAQGVYQVLVGIQGDHGVAGLFQRLHHVLAAGQGEPTLKGGAAHNHGNS